jgi:hypothetical protein
MKIKYGESGNKIKSTAYLQYYPQVEAKMSQTPSLYKAE